MDIDPYDHNLSRDQLIQAVEDGKLPREEAEKQALARGLGPLLPSHPVDDFDPMKQERWTLLMALVWVLGRNSEAVRNSWNDYLATQYHWAKEGIVGPLRALRRPNRWVHQIQMFSRSGEHMFAGSPGRSFSVSWTQLRLALRNGAVTAWGRDLREGDLADVRPIPSANWEALQAGAMPHRESRASNLRPLPRIMVPAKPDTEDMLHFGDGRPVYVSVTVERAALVGLFRKPAEDDNLDGHVTSVDPVKQITDALPEEETKPARRKRVRMEAINAVFPTGVPPTMPAKERDRRLEAQVKRMDGDIAPYSSRSWQRLCDEASKKAK